MKTHQLAVANGAGATERLVDRQERFIIKSGPDLRSWKVAELERISVEPSYDDQQLVLYVDNGRGATFITLPRGARVELGDDAWKAADIHSLVLAPIQKEPEPLAPPYEPGTWRVHHFDGSTQMLEGVERFEDLSVYVWQGGIAVPPVLEEATV